MPKNLIKTPIRKKARELIPNNRRLAKSPEQPIQFCNEKTGFSYQLAGKSSGISRREINHSLNIIAETYTATVLYYPFRLLANKHLKKVIDYYINKSNRVINKITALVLENEINLCKKNNINLVHGKYSSLKEIAIKYKYLSKYSRFLYLRNQIVKPALEKHKIKFIELNQRSNVMIVLDIYKKNRRLVAQEILSYMHLLYLFKIWLCYRDIEKIKNEIQQLLNLFKTKRQ